MQTRRILIADRFKPWAQMLESILSKEPSYEIVCTVFDGSLALKKAEELKPDLMLVDVNLSTTNGIDLTRSIQHISPKPLVIFVSQDTTPSIVRAALEAGARGYVIKTEANRELIEAIRTVCTGQRFLSKKLDEMVSSR